MSFPNRKTLRTDLVTKLKALSIGAVLPLADETHTVTPTPPADPYVVVDQVHVFPNFTKDPGGISPFACVDSGSAFYNITGNEGELTKFGMVIGFWAKRDDDDGADDMLDDLAQALATCLYLNYNARYLTQSVSDNEVLAGVPYKFELHFVEFDI